ncbi:MAG: hypothetical protein R3293_10705 [Candidatus Promineifilaceae bacterium]|nr:hypothetical protein [Candidatus Promineifilaceae bacterium]
MPYTVNESKMYLKTTEQVFEAAQKAVAGLQGKILEEDAGAGTLKGQFDKKIHGQVLGDRTQILVEVTPKDAERSVISVEVYPINPVGQKLMFGAREGVSQKVTGWYWAHVEHNLK